MKINILIKILKRYIKNIKHFINMKLKFEFLRNIRNEV